MAMEHAYNKIVRIGVEETRGTAVTGTLTSPFVGDGWTRSLTPHVAKIRSSAVGGAVAQVMGVGKTPGMRGTPVVNVETVRDIIEMATVRTANVMPSVTFEDTGHGVSEETLAGCLCTSLELSFSRSATPGDEAFLAAVMEFAAMKIGSTSGITAGTQGFGNNFVLSKSTFTINSVPAVQVRSFTWRHTNEISYPVHDSDGWPADIVNGGEDDEIIVVADFTTAAWEALAIAQTVHACSMILTTGTATETVTLATTKTIISAYEQGRDGGIVTEQITLTPAHDGTNRPVTPTFGAAIGAGVLLLAA